MERALLNISRAARSLEMARHAILLDRAWPAEQALGAAARRAELAFTDVFSARWAARQKRVTR